LPWRAPLALPVAALGAALADSTGTRRRPPLPPLVFRPSRPFHRAASTGKGSPADPAKVDGILGALSNFEAKTDSAEKGKAAAEVCKKVAELVSDGKVDEKLLKAVQDKDGTKSEEFFINRLTKAMNAVGSDARKDKDFDKADTVLSASRAKHAVLGCGPEPDAFMGTRMCSWVC